MTPVSVVLQWLDRSNKLTSIFTVNSPARELWKIVRRIAEGKGGSKCPGPELKKSNLSFTCHALPEGNLVNRADTDFS